MKWNLTFFSWIIFWNSISVSWFPINLQSSSLFSVRKSFLPCSDCPGSLMLKRLVYDSLGLHLCLPHAHSFIFLSEILVSALPPSLTWCTLLTSAALLLVCWWVQASFQVTPQGLSKESCPRNLPEPPANGVENKDFVFCPDNLWYVVKYIYDIYIYGKHTDSHTGTHADTYANP